MQEKKFTEKKKQLLWGSWKRAKDLGVGWERVKAMSALAGKGGDGGQTQQCSLDHHAQNPSLGRDRSCFGFFFPKSQTFFHGGQWKFGSWLKRKSEEGRKFTWCCRARNLGISLPPAARLSSIPLLRFKNHHPHDIKRNPKAKTPHELKSQSLQIRST